MIEVHSEIGPVAQAWEELATRTGAPPFLYPGWIAAWQRAFDPGDVGVACAGRDRFTAVIPIRSRRTATLSPTNSHTFQFGAVSEDGASSRELFEGLLGSRPRRLDLSFLDREGDSYAACERAARDRGYATICRPVQSSPYLAIEGDWESYRSTLAGKRRRNLSRCRRRLEEQGSKIEVEDGGEGLERLLEEGFRVEAAGWKGSRGTAIASDPRTRLFYTEVARWAAERGWLRLWFLHLQARAIAFALCLETNGRLYELKIGFDPSYGRFAPGLVLAEERLRHAFSTGLLSYEFLGQAEPHKLEWTSSCRRIVRLQAFAPDLPGRASRLVWTTGREAARRLAKPIRDAAGR